MEMTTAVLVFGATIFLALVTVYKKRKKSQARDRLLEELSMLQWDNPKEALENLKAVSAISEKARPIARHYLTVWVGNLMIDRPNFKAALTAEERFSSEWKQICKYCLDFKIKTSDICPFTLEEIHKKFLCQQIQILSKMLEHYPGSGWNNWTVGQVFTTLLNYSNSADQRPEIEVWKGWVKEANLRQAKNQLSLLRRNSRRYRYPEDFNEGVAKLRKFLDYAKEGPEAIGATEEEIEGFKRKLA